MVYIAVSGLRVLVLELRLFRSLVFFMAWELFKESSRFAPVCSDPYHFSFYCG